MSDSEHDYDSDDSAEGFVDNHMEQESESEDEQANIGLESENEEHTERDIVEKVATEDSFLQSERDISLDSSGNSSAGSSNPFKNTCDVEAGVGNVEGGSVDNEEGAGDDTTAHAIFGDDLSDDEAGEKVSSVNNSPVEFEGDDSLDKPHDLTEEAKEEVYFIYT